MATSLVKYIGGLRTEATHIQSNTKIITDAPLDNHGKGEAFSPTDLMATSLANCMLTIMGIKANTEGMTGIDGTIAEVTKVMASDPRRVSEIHIHLKFPKNKYTEKEKKIYENVAHTCPVAKSLHPDLKQVITIEW
ncbi:MAG: OsmC family protein [Bacteroidetes bacterium]|jgi:putative redox protein|nr:OsmC family protein [Bacteroidota bacterium]MCA6444783.1 OsmC family protein [Bacteroidota bacterium]